jgi:hypothetical protein
MAYVFLKTYFFSMLKNMLLVEFFSLMEKVLVWIWLGVEKHAKYDK